MAVFLLGNLWEEQEEVQALFSKYKFELTLQLLHTLVEEQVAHVESQFSHYFDETSPNFYFFLIN